MKNISENLAVQSFCFRHYKNNEEVAEAVASCGLKHLELSMQSHLKPADMPTFRSVSAVYRNSGIELVGGLGVAFIRNNEVRERALCELARDSGVGMLMVDFIPEVGTLPAAFETADRLADETGVRMAIHIHGGRHWLGNAKALRMVFGMTSERVGLCLDTAWALDAGEDPVEMAREFAPRLFSVHLKDFVFDRAGKPEDVVVGTGNLDLPSFFTALDETGYSGPLILEYEGDAENPVPSVKNCADNVRKELEAWKNR